MRLVHSRFHAPTPSAGEFRTLTHRAFSEALQRAGTAVCAPLSRIDLLVPAASLTAVLALVLAAGGRPEPVKTGVARCRVIGTIPTGEVGDLERRLPDLTSGQGVLLTRADRLLRGPWRAALARAVGSAPRGGEVEPEVGRLARQVMSRSRACWSSI